MELTSIRARCLVPASSPLQPADIKALALTIVDGRIASIDELPQDSTCDVPHIIAPGFVDLQINGLDADDLWEIARHDDLTAWQRLENKLLDQGVTGWCPTFISAPSSDYIKLTGFLETLDQRSSSTSFEKHVQPRILGLHLEGPYLGSVRGAHAAQAISEPEWTWLPEIISRVALMTLGAESEGSEELCRTLNRHGVVVSLGHTAPSHQQYTALRQAGVTMVTHLFNGMSGLQHRQPGLAAWALTDDGVFCSLIADGVHVDPTMIRLAFRSQPNRVVLVTDRVAHLSPRHQDRLHVADGAVRLSNGTLAGSLLTMSQAIRVCVELAGISPGEALSAATTHPAQVLGLTSQGQIAVGARADLIALDDHYNVQAVWLEGQRVR